MQTKRSWSGFLIVFFFSGSGEPVLNKDGRLMGRVCPRPAMVFDDCWTGGPVGYWLFLGLYYGILLISWSHLARNKRKPSEGPDLEMFFFFINILYEKEEEIFC